MASSLAFAWSLGSSPLTRGKLPLDRLQRLASGLIPTHAGNTLTALPCGSLTTAHPRSCGENRRILVDQWRRWGSSPLMRGKPVSVPSDEPVGGLIPAHAGKTPACPSPFYRRWAHPHSCGENRPMNAMCAVLLGSSPLTRAKPACTMRRARCIGLIPTHAGKTGHRTRGPTNSPAHPHSCGENILAMMLDASERGSSPLMRGKRTGNGIRELVPGLIPAHAGKTPCPASSHSSRRAHPRSRGENHRARVALVFMLGSSPLTRGKPLGRQPIVAGRRLIPAHAGKARS